MSLPSAMTETRLQLYNTMTRRKEVFATIEPGKVRLYVCGVTVYDSAHIGHGMSLIIFDMMRRYLEHSGYVVRHAQNFTDIDDKIINRANALGIDPNELTERLIADWLTESAALNVLPATIYPRATREIDAIVQMIDGLIDRGNAYAVAGDVYFRVRSFAGYGKLSHRSPDDLLSGARIDVNELKEDPLDFALWKAVKPGEPWWDSPWSQGRPGWHIECSAMCTTHLNDVVDIHGGGAVLIFPHHENEIAQSEAFLQRKPFARYWVHNGLLQLSGEKMSKSLGNMVRIKEIIDRGLAPAFRLMVLQSQSRAPLSYTEDGLQAAERGLDRLRSAVREVGASTPTSNTEEVAPTFQIAEVASDVDSRFHSAMDDDFDTPVAVAALFDLGRALNRTKSTSSPSTDILQAQATLTRLSGVLGLSLADDSNVIGGAKPYIELLVQIRDELRAAKQWALSDRIRDELHERGITVEDGASRSTWRPA